MRKFLVAIAALIFALALSMGGNAHARGCVGATSGGPTPDNSVEKATGTDVDMSYRDIKSGNFQICGIPDWKP